MSDCAGCGCAVIEKREKCIKCDPRGPKDRAILRASKVFGESRGYSDLWDALVAAYTCVYAEEERRANGS